MSKMIGIIGAMQVEVEGLCSLIENCVTKELFGTEKYRAVNWVTQITTSSAHVTIKEKIQ